MCFSLSLAIKQQLSSQICPFGSHKNALRALESEGGNYFLINFLMIDEFNLASLPHHMHAGAL
jgi:hypothetical protein